MAVAVVVAALLREHLRPLRSRMPTLADVPWRQTPRRALGTQSKAVLEALRLREGEPPMEVELRLKKRTTHRGH